VVVKIISSFFSSKFLSKTSSKTKNTHLHFSKTAKTLTFNETITTQPNRESFGEVKHF
jgi:hypothetical protein